LSNAVVLVLFSENLYSVIVVNKPNRFFSGRIGQSEAIRVDYNQCGHLSYIRQATLSQSPNID